jgi:hypothetical protein
LRSAALDEVGRWPGRADNAGLAAADTDFAITTSCTGVLIPALCAHRIPGRRFR